MIAQKLRKGLTIAALISGVDAQPCTCYENPGGFLFAIHCQMDTIEIASSLAVGHSRSRFSIQPSQHLETISNEQNITF
jgi:hypothetical protein